MSQSGQPGAPQPGGAPPPPPPSWQSTPQPPAPPAGSGSGPPNLETSTAWLNPPYLTLLQTPVKIMRCPSTSDQPFYDDNSRGVMVPKRAAASYVVVISGTIQINNNNDDGNSVGGPLPPWSARAGNSAASPRFQATMFQRSSST